MQTAFSFLTLLLISNLAFAQLNGDETLAGQYFQNGDFEKAAVLYQKLFNKTKNQNYYDPLFNSLLQAKQYEEAEQLVRRQIKSSPSNYIFSIDIGRIYQERGQPEKALEWYNKLIKELPKNEFAIRDLANMFYRTQAFDYSIKTLTTGRKILNDDQAFTYELISLYRYRKDKVMLIQEFLNLLATSPEILRQAENTLSAVFEENTDYELLKTSLLKRIQKDPQNLAYTELLTWQYIQQKEFDLALKQTFALDRRLKEEGDRVYDLSRLLMQNRAYEQAVEALNYLANKGTNGKYYIPSKIDLLFAKIKLITAGKYNSSDLINLEKDHLSLLEEFGRNSSTAFAIRQLANLQSVYLNKPKEAEILLEQMLEIPNLPNSMIGETKLELGDTYISTGEVWEAALIYGQVEKQFGNEPLGQEAKFRHAKLSYYQGDFDWAKAQLDVLKSSTSLLIANDALNLSLLISDNLQSETDTNALKKYAYADMLIFKNLPDEALATLDSMDNRYPGHSLTDDILMSKARIFVAKNEFSTAAALLQRLMDNHSADLWGDDAIFMLAEIYETKLNQPEKAKALYQKIITDYPGSLFAIEARKRFRNLRGDNLG